MIQLDEVIIIREGHLVCPFCQSGDVVYCEEVTAHHRIIGVTDDRIMVSPVHQTEEPGEGMDGRFVCRSCGFPSALPDYVRIEEYL